MVQYGATCPARALESESLYDACRQRREYGEMPRFKIPIEAYVYGEISVLAGTLAEAMEKAQEMEESIKTIPNLKDAATKLKVDGIIALEPEVREASDSYKKTKKKKVKVRRGGGGGIKVSATGNRKGRARGRKRA